MVTGVFLVTVNVVNCWRITTGVLLSFYGVAYVGAVDVFGLRCIVESVRFKLRVARGVANGLPSQLSILFLVCSLLACSIFLVCGAHAAC
jgi:hypothetical protein